ncbi:MAG: hypoxanthine phosphoribosyltransferase [Acidimicrobiia bacterium]|nr:hypoxanthine phosphoribosyltransferase [Acidimicrobiia bacterium]
MGEVLVTEAEIVRRTMEIGAQITADMKGETPLLVGVLKGSVMFVADLMRAIAGPVELDFLAVSSYGAETESTGVVKILKDLDNEVTGRHIVLVEDIVDSGLTLRYLMSYLKAKNPTSVRTCTLLLRQGDHNKDLEVDYVGFVLPAAFVVGYGLDARQQYRNLPYIAEYTGD